MRTLAICVFAALLAGCAQVRGGNEHSVTVSAKYSQFGGTQKAYDEAGAWCAKFGKSARLSSRDGNQLTFDCVK